MQRPPIFPLSLTYWVRVAQLYDMLPLFITTPGGLSEDLLRSVESHGWWPFLSFYTLPHKSFQIADHILRKWNPEHGRNAKKIPFQDISLTISKLESLFDSRQYMKASVVWLRDSFRTVTFFPTAGGRDLLLHHKHYLLQKKTYHLLSFNPEVNLSFKDFDLIHTLYRT